MLKIATAALTGAARWGAAAITPLGIHTLRRRLRQRMQRPTLLLLPLTRRRQGRPTGAEACFGGGDYGLLFSCFLSTGGGKGGILLQEEKRRRPTGSSPFSYQNGGNWWLVMLLPTAPAIQQLAVLSGRDRVDGAETLFCLYFAKIDHATKKN